MPTIAWDKVTRNTAIREKLRPIEPQVDEIFQKLFKDDEELIVENMFGSGYSGALVFHTVAVNDGEANIPSVVKIDDHREIEDEYQKMLPLKNRVPNGSYAKQAPAKSSGELSGLQFEFGGQGLAEVVSLKKFLLNAEWKHIKHVIDELLMKPMNRFWRTQRAEQYAWFNYDGQLPANFELDYLESATRFDDELIPDKFSFFRWDEVEAGQTKIIKLVGLQVTAVKPTYIKLNLPSGSHKNCFQIKLNTQNAERSFEVGDKLAEPIYGRVIQTRLAFLREAAEDVLPKNNLDKVFDPQNRLIVRFNEHQLSNPIESLDDLMHTERSTVNRSLIHGDLNLENVLVTTFVHGSPRDIVIIDFASVKKNAHILRDFLCLELNVWLYVVSEELSRLNMGKEVDAFFTAVHLPNQVQTKYHALKSFKIIQNIRGHVKNHLIDQNDWDEYFKGLQIYMLGALDYDNLNEIETHPTPKGIAIWVASLCSSYPSADFTDLNKWLPENAIMPRNDGNKSMSPTGTPDLTSQPKVKVDQSAPPLNQGDLLERMTKTLIDADLQKVCWHLEIPLEESNIYERLGTGGIQTKMMALIGFCKRRKRLLNLIEILELMRPHEKWRKEIIQINRSAPPLSKYELRAQMINTFSEDDLRRVCLQLKIAPDAMGLSENLGLALVQTKIIRLVEKFQSPIDLLKLTEAIEEVRPYERWRVSKN
ncbi:MAG: hypothetical protein AAF490_20070 [Chloroflexota bacterium]